MAQKKKKFSILACFGCHVLAEKYNVLNSVVHRMCSPLAGEGNSPCGGLGFLPPNTSYWRTFWRATSRPMVRFYSALSLLHMQTLTDTERLRARPRAGRLAFTSTRANHVVSTVAGERGNTTHGGPVHPDVTTQRSNQNATVICCNNPQQTHMHKAWLTKITIESPVIDTSHKSDTTTLWKMSLDVVANEASGGQFEHTFLNLLFNYFYVWVSNPFVPSNKSSSIPATYIHREKAKQRS